MRLPGHVDELADSLATMAGATAVVLGGSRAAGVPDVRSDWDLVVYYRGRLDLAPLAARGQVHPPGSWGRVMNGGAWLTHGTTKVDVMLRDLDVVEHWSRAAADGTYEVDALLGYLAGVPTYTLTAEHALGRVLRGALPEPPALPARLAEVAEERWRYHSRFSLDHARMRAGRGDVAGTVGQAAKAVLEQAHAICAARRVWVTNEKRLIEDAGLGRVQPLFSDVPADGLDTWLARLEAALG